MVVLAGSAGCLAAQDDTAELKKELAELRNDYQSRIDRLEARIRELEAADASSHRGASGKPEPKRDKDIEMALERERRAAVTAEAARRTVNETFKEDTETRDLADQSRSDTMLSQRIEDVLEGYMDITGYFRAGYGRSNEGGPQRAFGIPGVAKYRLGNEAENYGELAFAKSFYPSGVFAGNAPGENDPIARMTYRLSFVNPYSDYGSAASTDFASPEVWASLSNVIPGHSDAKLWAGNRFYRRHDININDFYFWDMSGGGGGIEDFTFGPGKLAFAWIGSGSQSSIYSQVGIPDPTNLAGFSKSSFDLRYYDWDFLGGKGEVGLTFSTSESGVDSTGAKAEDSDGFALSLVRTDTGFLDKESLHKLSVQFGTGPAKTFTSGFETFTDSTGTYIKPDANDSWRFRATDQVVVKPIEQLALGSALVYQYTDYGDAGPDQQWVSGGVRPIWFFNDVFSLAFEGGVDWVSETANGNGGTLGKLTLAPQVSLGDQFFSRPVLRAFVTYAMWGNDLVGEIGGPDFAASDNGWSWGLQMESWW